MKGRAVYEGRAAELVAAVFRVDRRRMVGRRRYRRPFVAGELGEHGPNAADAAWWGVEVSIVGGRYAREPFIRRDGSEPFTATERASYLAAVTRELSK